MIQTDDDLRTGGIPALEASLSIDMVTSRLAPFLGGSGGLRVVAVDLVSHKPGKRAVIAYQMAGPSGEARALIGKVYADAERAERLHNTLEQLGALDVPSGVFGVPRAVALFRDWGMSVQESACGRSIDQLDGRERIDGATAVGHWLATFQRSEIAFDRTLNLDSERRNLGAWADLVSEDQPAVALKTARLLEQLIRLGDEVEVSIGIPMHKDFQYQHTLVDGNRVVVIDVDEARAGDAALDVAHFCAYLRLLALREGTPRDGMAPVESAFLDAYASSVPYQPDSRHRFFLAYACMKIAKQLVRGRGPTPAPHGAELTRQLELIIEEGLRCSAG